MNLRHNIRLHCKLQGTTQKELAAKIGVTETSLSMTVAKNNPQLSTLEKIAEGLGISVVELLTDPALPKPLEHQPPTPRQGLFCPHCGKPLTLFIRAGYAGDQQPGGQEQ